MVSHTDPGVQFLLRDFREWSVVRSFFCANGHNRHQIDGFNKFCHDILPHITTSQQPVRAYTDTEVHTIRFLGVSIHRPNMTEADGHTHSLQPFEARTRSLTYACPVFADIEYTVEARTGKATSKEPTNLEDDALNQNVNSEVGYESEGEEDLEGRPSEASQNSKAAQSSSSETSKTSSETSKASESSSGVRKRECTRVPFFRLPCMIGSDFCTLSSPDCEYNPVVEDPFERGGYFVVNGKEKMITVQMRLRGNVVMVMKARKNDKFSMVAEVRSNHPGKWRSTSTLRLGLVTRQHRMTIFSLVPFVMRGNGFLEVPLVLLFVVFGASRKDMLRYICFPSASEEVARLAEQVVSHPMADMTPEQAMGWISTHGVREKTPERCMATTRGIFAHEILPHIGSRLEPRTNANKCMFLGKMTRRLLEVHLRLRVPDDRDNFANKTVHNGGTLLAVIFRQIFRNTNKVMRSNLYKAVKRGHSVNLSEMINHRKITSSLRYHFATGNWSMQQNTNTGVVMPMPRTCHQVAVSFQRRINTQCNKDSRATECRFLHPSDLGINCINETPEGQGCGIVENLAMFTHVSMGVPSDAVVPVLLGLPGAREPPEKMPPPPDRALITVNGALVGVVQRGEGAELLAREVRRMRLAGGLPFDLGVVLTAEGDVQVSTEVGRCLRPLYRVEAISRIPEALSAAGGPDASKGPELWRELLLHGIVEYLDKAEEQSVARPAPRIQDLLDHPDRGYTHVEIDPVAALGLLSASQPFPERNQSPRNIYQATMGKQCISLPVMNWEHRVDRHLHVLNYPQQPVVTTQLETVQDYDRYPHGMSAVVAIMCYGGFNQEDSILFSQSAIDRGFARITYYRTYSDHIKRTGAYDTEKYEIPGADVHGIKGKADYSKLSADGFVRVGEVVRHGDVIIGKTVCVSEVLSTGERNTIKHDQSVVVREHDVGRVDKVIATSKPNGNVLVQVRLRFVRAPVVGDKFASRYAQKGTIGAILPREDMPFTVKDGIVPDIIMNPNAIPSRMTVGQLLECALGKAALLSGRRGNGTAFRGVDARDIMKELHRLGYQGGGKERMRNGMTGELIEAPIFIGPTYYQQLRHFVKDKIHSRSDDGSNRTLTRQPMEGRSRGGGFRFGEMERDAVICHGASKFMLDRMFYNSDKYFVPVCLNCGTIAIPKTNRAYGVSVHQKDWCPMCEGRSKVKRVRMPYATKLCLQELMALHVMPRVRLSNALENI